MNNLSIQLRTEIVAFFYNKHIVGNMKGYPTTHTTSDWIIQARFLLSNMCDETIDRLLDKTDDMLYENQAIYVGIWIVALLKKEKYIPQIALQLLKSENPYYSSLVFSALLLFDDLPITSAHYYIQFIRENESNNKKDDCVSLAFYCLQYIDSKYHTNYSQSYLGITVPTRYQKIIDKILKYSEILRANICFRNNDFEQFQIELKHLLLINTSPREYALGLVKAKNIDIFVYNTTSIYKFYCAVQNFLQCKEINDKPTNEEIVKEKLLETNYLFDILAGIEADWYYQLSSEIIIIAFEKILKLLPNCAYVYEQYALHLLFRSGLYDDEAKIYYQKSLDLRVDYEQVYDEQISATYIIKKCNVKS